VLDVGSWSGRLPTCTGFAVGRLYAYDATTGGQLWGVQAAGVIGSTPAPAEARVFAGGRHGGVYVVDGDDGGAPPAPAQSLR
jgi:outer membrane protein assembly factor BamB